MEELSEINKKFIEIKNDKRLLLSEGQGLITRIQNLPLDIRGQEPTIKLYEEIGQVLFEMSVEFANYDVKEFKDQIAEWKNRNETDKKIEKKYVNYSLAFDNELNKLLECITFHQNKLRRYLILSLGLEEFDSIEVALIHDSKRPDTFLTDVAYKLGCESHVYSLDDFLNYVNKDKKNTKFIMLLKLLPDATEKDMKQSILFLNKLESNFDNMIKNIIVTNFEKPFKYIIEKDFKKIIEEIDYLVGMDLYNQELEPGEEKIIKKIFKNRGCDSVEYKILSGGFSGAKVLEVRPLKKITTKKYVMKLNSIENVKIQREKSNHDLYVKDCDTAHSFLDTEQTEKYFAIMYEYASSDLEIDSKSFAEIISKIEYSEIDYYLKIIDNLFNLTIFNSWDKGKRQKKHSAKELYSSFIKFNDIVQQIEKILDTKNEFDKDYSLLSQFESIFNLEFDCNTKICHGDLHSENFFIDDKNEIILIDFGDTGELHSLIDFVTLESSIRFKHISKYYNLDELLKYEKQLFTIDSFKNNFNLDFINHKNLTKYFKIILKIREHALKYICNNSLNEYLIALFMITFRQIRYPDLNQIYALRFAELLAEHILVK
jgi:hypothetical protein